MLKTSLKIYNTLRVVVTKVYHTLNLKKYENKKGRKEIIQNIDAITLGILKQAQGIATKKSLFEIIDPHCSYKTLVVSINRCGLLLQKILGYILVSNRMQSHLIKHVDATDLPVCSLRKARSHKTMKMYAHKSKSSKGWFYGLKLHLTVDLEGRILAIRFTSGNSDDRDVLKSMNNDLRGIFVADAGYVSQKLEQEFYIENERILYTCMRTNMKKIATFDDIELLQTRMKIENHFGVMKEFRNLTSTVSRSVQGYFVNYLSSVLSYMIA
jgi:hypothetical protein